MLKRLRVLLFETPDDPWFNMAFEEAFVRVRAAGIVKDDCLRIWRNSEAIVVGYLRNVADEVNVELARKFKVPIIRRFTGGGAVYHDLGNVNYSIVVKPEEKIEKPIDYIYSKLLSGVLIALKKLGVNPYVENINDIVVENRKVSGTAATLFWNILFLHGSLLVNANLNMLRELLKIPKNKPYTKKINPVKYRAANLNDLLKTKASMREVIEALILGYEEALKVKAYLDKPLKLELKIAEILYKGKYLRTTWNTERCSILEYKELEEEINKILSKHCTPY
ncbi:MAG: lipoate--protein ligase family protein [Thermoprotei archaeon]|nr:MAG: lipoate--protein ligase family protein [Thermoprotei archaeon]